MCYGGRGWKEGGHKSCREGGGGGGGGRVTAGGGQSFEEDQNLALEKGKREGRGCRRRCWVRGHAYQDDGWKSQ